MFKPTGWSLTADGPATLFIATMPNAVKIVKGLHNTFGYTHIACDKLQTGAMQSLSNSSFDLFADSSFVQCQARNATYSISFDYTATSPQIAINEDLDVNGPPIIPVEWVHGPNLLIDRDTVRPPSAIAKLDQGTCNPLNRDPVELSPDYPPINCHFDETLLETLSYQAILDAFTSQITGSVYLELFDPSLVPTANSSVLETLLADTQMLRYLTRPTVAGSLVEDLQSAASAWNGTFFPSLVSSNRDQSKDLTQSLESAFQKSVVSLMSYRELQ